MNIPLQVLLLLFYEQESLIVEEWISDEKRLVSIWLNRCKLFTNVINGHYVRWIDE